MENKDRKASHPVIHTISGSGGFFNFKALFRCQDPMTTDRFLSLSFTSLWSSFLRIIVEALTAVHSAFALVKLFLQHDCDLMINGVLILTLLFHRNDIIAGL